MSFSGCSAATAKARVPFPIMLHQGRIVAVDGGRGVIQRRQKVFLDIADIGGVVLHAVHDILNM